MSVYHRTYARIPLALDVQLHFKGKALGHAFTRDINSFGTFIELSKPELETDDFISISFKGKDVNHAKVMQKGMVMHRNTEGIGILFARDTEEFRTMLQKEVSHADNTKIDK